MLWGYGIILMRQIARRESSLLQMFFGNLFFALVTGAMTLFTWHTPAAVHRRCCCSAIACSAGSASSASSRPRRHAPASLLATFEYSALLWAFALRLPDLARHPAGLGVPRRGDDHRRRAVPGARRAPRRTPAPADSGSAARTALIASPASRARKPASREARNAGLHAAPAIADLVADPPRGAPPRAGPRSSRARPMAARAAPITPASSAAPACSRTRCAGSA